MIRDIIMHVLDASCMKYFHHSRCDLNLESLFFIFGDKPSASGVSYWEAKHNQSELISSVCKWIIIQWLQTCNPSSQRWHDIKHKGPYKWAKQRGWLKWSPFHNDCWGFDVEQLKVIFLCLDYSTNSSLIFFFFFFSSFIVIKTIKDFRWGRESYISTWNRTPYDQYYYGRERETS